MDFEAAWGDALAAAVRKLWNVDPSRLDPLLENRVCLLL